MLNLPGIKYSPESSTNPQIEVVISMGDARLCRVVMQQFATQVMQFMVERGSKLKLFNANPTVALKDEVNHPADANGHFWPNYTYVRGRTIDATGRTKVIAVPFAGGYRDMTDSAVLCHSAL